MNETIGMGRFWELDARRVADVAESTGLIFYAASYLTLALMSNETLSTDDRELTEEARKLGVKAEPA
jgi:predicted nucleic acid-binding protein